MIRTKKRKRSDEDNVGMNQRSEKKDWSLRIGAYGYCSIALSPLGVVYQKLEEVIILYLNKLSC